jgi:hypothetical protein
MDIQMVLIANVPNYTSGLQATEKKLTQWSLVPWKRTSFGTSNYTITYDTQSQQNNFPL